MGNCVSGERDRLLAEAFRELEQLKLHAAALEPKQQALMAALRTLNERLRAEVRSPSPFCRCASVVAHYFCRGVPGRRWGGDAGFQVSISTVEARADLWVGTYTEYATVQWHPGARRPRVSQPGV